MTGLTRAKIALLESKEDYVEAFMQHMNNEQLKKIVFKWLFDTFFKLTQINDEL